MLTAHTNRKINNHSPAKNRPIDLPDIERRLRDEYPEENFDLTLGTDGMGYLYATGKKRDEIYRRTLRLINIASYYNALARKGRARQRARWWQITDKA